MAVTIFVTRRRADRAREPSHAFIVRHRRGGAEPDAESAVGGRGSLCVGVVVTAIYLLVPRATQGQTKAASQAQASAARGVPVVAAPARRGDMGVYLTGIGTATALNTVTVRSRVDGQLIKVSFTEGQIVHEGDLLAELDSRPFQVQLTQAEGQAAKDQATLKDAQLDLDRYQNLVTQGILPRQQLDTQRATADQAAGSLRADQGQIDSARLNLTYARITAPLTGRVGLRLVDVGNIVHATDQNGLVVITQLDPIAVLFTIPEDSLPQVMQQLRAGRPPDGGRLRSRSEEEARHGNVAHHGQSDRSDDGDREAQGDVSEYRQRPLSQPVRQRPSAHRHGSRRGHRAERRHSAQSAINVRLRRPAG